MTSLILHWQGLRFKEKRQFLRRLAFPGSFLTDLQRQKASQRLSTYRTFKNLLTSKVSRLSRNFLDRLVFKRSALFLKLSCPWLSASFKLAGSVQSLAPVLFFALARSPHWVLTPKLNVASFAKILFWLHNCLRCCLHFGPLQLSMLAPRLLCCAGTTFLHPRFFLVVLLTIWGSVCYYALWISPERLAYTEVGPVAQSWISFMLYLQDPTLTSTIVNEQPADFARGESATCW